MLKYNVIRNLSSENYGNINMVNNLKSYKASVEKIYQKARYSIDSDRYYSPIEELVKTNSSAKSVKLRIVQDEENLRKHFLEVTLGNSASGNVLTRPIAYGDKEDILKYLLNPESPSGILKNVEQMEQNASRMN